MIYILFIKFILLSISCSCKYYWKCFHASKRTNISHILSSCNPSKFERYMRNVFFRNIVYVCHIYIVCHSTLLHYQVWANIVIKHWWLPHPVFRHYILWGHITSTRVLVSWSRCGQKWRPFEKKDKLEDLGAYWMSGGKQMTKIRCGV